MTSTRFLPLAATAAALSLAACGQGEPTADTTPAPAQQAEGAPVTAQANTITVKDAWCRPTPNGAKAGGCYVILTSTGDDRLIGITSAAASMPQIHEMKFEDGMMKMSHLENGRPMTAGQPLELKPGGDHIMLMGLNGPLVAGQSVSITLDFEKAEDMTVDFDIKTPPVVGGEE